MSWLLDFPSVVLSLLHVQVQKQQNLQFEGFVLFGFRLFACFRFVTFFLVSFFIYFFIFFFLGNAGKKQPSDHEPTLALL